MEEAKKDSPPSGEGAPPPAASEGSGEINPHIPQFISRAPWYLNQSKPSLTHQRYQPQQKVGLHAWYKRGLVTAPDGQAAPKKSKFQKGSCQNCGSGTHSAKDCTERPRAKPAKFSQKDLMPDEIIEPPPELNYEAKRDRYSHTDSHTDSHTNSHTDRRRFSSAFWVQVRGLRRRRLQMASAGIRGAAARASAAKAVGAEAARRLKQRPQKATTKTSSKGRIQRRRG